MRAITKALCVFTMLVAVSCRTFHEVIWNARYFPHAQLAKASFKVHIDDQLTIKCPKMEDNSLYQYSKIYMVSRMEYQNCLLLQPKWVGVCNDETRNTSIKMVFREFTPMPNGFEFQPYNNYYLISTSNGRQRGINQTMDGLCTFYGMKMKITVLEKETFFMPTRANRYESNFHDWDAYNGEIMYQIHEAGELVSASNILFGLVTAILLLFHFI